MCVCVCVCVCVGSVGRGFVYVVNVITIFSMAPRKLIYTQFLSQPRFGGGGGACARWNFIFEYRSSKMKRDFIPERFLNMETSEIMMKGRQRGVTLFRRKFQS